MTESIDLRFNMGSNLNNGTLVFKYECIMINHDFLFFPYNSGRAELIHFKLEKHSKRCNTRAATLTQYHDLNDMMTL